MKNSLVESENAIKQGRRTTQANRPRCPGQWCKSKDRSYNPRVFPTKGTCMEPETYYAIAGTAAAMIVLSFVYRYIQVGGDFARDRKARQIAQRYQSDAKFK